MATFHLQSFSNVMLQMLFGKLIFLRFFFPGEFEDDKTAVFFVHTRTARVFKMSNIFVRKIKPFIWFEFQRKCCV